MSFEDELNRELIELRRGRGLQEIGLAKRLGPLLRELTGAYPADPDALARQKVRTTLAELTADLPEDMRIAAELALAFAARSGNRLTTRIQVYADELHCSERTARRRMNEAVQAVARAATTRRDPAAAADPGSGWRVRSFTALMRLDTLDRQLFETRVIVAERELHQVEIKLDLPPGPGADGPALPLEIDVVYGARLTATERSANGRHYRMDVTLPRPLQPEEQQEFCLHYRVPPEQPIRSHCAIVPLDPCDQGRVRVRFNLDDMPAAIWPLSGVAPRQMDQATTVPAPERLVPDGAGEVVAAFRNLRQGHGYGVAWQPA